MSDKTVRLGGLPYRVSDPEQEISAFEAGATPISQGQALESQQAQNDLEAVDKNWGASGKLAMGGLSGLTLGLGPGILANQGLVNPGHIQAMQTSPWYTAGDVAGTVLPALFTGGESALGSAARFTPAGLASMAGEGSARLAGGILGDSAGLMGRLGSGAIREAARGSTEGALYSLGHQVGDNLIQNKPLAAEAMAATAGGALFGGLVGGGIGTAGAAMSHGIESLGSIASKAGTNKALGKVAQTLGMGSEETQAALRSEGGLWGTIERYGKEIRAGGSDIGEATSSKIEAVGKRQDVHTKLREEAVQAMQDHAPMNIPSVARIAKGIDAEVILPRVNTAGEAKVQSIVDSFKADLPEHATWGNLIKTRDQIAAEVSKAPSGPVNPLMVDSPTVKREILNVLDREIRSGMESASKEHPHLAGMADQYSAATQGLKTTEELNAHLGKKLASNLLSQGNHLGAQDFSRAGWAAAFGHPVVAGTLLAAKSASRRMEGVVQPWLAQMAYNQSIGTKAAEATVGMKSRIGDSLKKFFSGAAKAPAKAVNAYRASESAKAQPDSRAAYEAMANNVEQLMSSNHHDRVQRYAQSMQTEGYDQLANEIMGLNQRAVLYAQQNMPPRQGAKSLTSLRKMPASKVPTFQEYKFMRIMDGVNRGPHALLDGLDDGSISRDSVKAMKYVYPEMHSEIVLQASQQIADMKQSGEYLPLDKIASLGVALDAPIDSVLQPDFVSAVQMALNSPPAGQPQDTGSGSKSSQPAPSGEISKDNPMLTTLQKTALG